MTWAYLFTEGTTKHLNEHKHTHASAQALLCLLRVRWSLFWSFYRECNSIKAVKFKLQPHGVWAIKTVCHFCFTRKDNHKRVKNAKLASIFFTASADYLRVQLKELLNKVKNAKLALFFLQREQIIFEGSSKNF